ncbi:MAG TPA: WD40 repeat domain-containing protein, partial [Bryobacteraceae bacterium]|nr:WD40 repeat domain-containing protein [Bryobacteraceae bacterium]
MNRVLSVALAIAAVFSLQAATTATWEMNTYQDLLKGRFEGVSLDRDGRLTLAPKLETLFTSGQPTIWSIARGPDGSIYAGTGHRGRVYQITSSGASNLIWTADQPEVFAVAVSPDGVLYAATSPDGKVYRIEKGKATEFFAPQAKYIWSLAFAKDGSLFVGAGNPGNVYRVDKTGRAETYYETGQAHVTALAFDVKGNLLAGSEPNGILYRISAKEKAFVVYNASLPEIRSIVPMPDGTIYAAALGGSIANRSTPLITTLSQPSGVTVSAPGTSITVTDSADSQAETDIKPKAGTPTTTVVQPVQQVASASPLTEIPNVDKSAVYRINPDDTVETLWTSKEENVYSLAARPNGSLYFSTDGQGRLYRLGADRKAALLVETNEGEATRLLESPDGLVAATGDMGKVFKLAEAANDHGSYESPVHDSGSIARWGRISWRNTPGTRGKVELQTRSGNSARPDKTWSDWSSPLTNSDDS